MIHKTSELINEKSHYLVPYEKSNKIKEIGFTASWNINERKNDYNALEDPYASHYFRYQSVKKHMKKYRKSLNKAQINEAQKKKMVKLIKQKLTDHLPSIKISAETYNISNKELEKSLIAQRMTNQKSFKSLNKEKPQSSLVKRKRKRKSKKKKHYSCKKGKVIPIQKARAVQSDDQEDPAFSNKQNPVNDVKQSTENSTYRKPQKAVTHEDKNQIERKEYMRKQQQLLHKKKHEDFLSFLVKKRMTLESPLAF